MMPTHDDSIELSYCPECGPDVEVVGHDVTRGADPYDVQQLACGHDVVWLSASDDDAVIVNTRPRRSMR